MAQKKVAEMTATERKAKRAADAERQQRLRDKKKLGDVAMSPEQQRTVVEARWKTNREALSPEDRADLETRVEEAVRIHNLMIKGSRLLRDDAEYGVGGLYIDLVFEEIEEFARKYPPTDGVSFSELLDRGACTIAEIADASESFQSYGEELDSINHVLYYDFLSLFKPWYKKFRDAGIVEQHWITSDDVDENGAPLEPDSWAQVDELVRSNPRLTPSAPTGLAPVAKQPEWQRQGFDSQAEYNGHLLDLKRTQRNIDLQQAAQKLDLMTPDERRKAELLAKVRSEL